MIQSRAWIVFFLVLIAGTNPALAKNDDPAERQTWVLEDDSIILGTLIEETSENYLVNTVFGEVRINKADLKKTRVSQISPLHSTVKQEETISYRGTVAIIELAVLGGLYMWEEGYLNRLPDAAITWSLLLGHGFGGSLVHLYHENYGKALASAGLRVGLPIVGFIAMDDSDDSFGKFLALIGAAAGMVVAPIIDIMFLAKKTESTISDDTLIEYGSLKATPSFGVTPRGELTFGLAGHF